MFASIAVTVTSCRYPGRKTRGSVAWSGFRNAPVRATRVLSVKDAQAPNGVSTRTWYAGARGEGGQAIASVSTLRLKGGAGVTVVSGVSGTMVSAVMTSPWVVTA